MFLKDSAKSLGGVFDREERWERDEREIEVSCIYQKSLAPFLLEKSELKIAGAEINLLSGTVTFSLIIFIIYLISFLSYSTLNITIFITQSAIVLSSLKIHLELDAINVESISRLITELYKIIIEEHRSNFSTIIIP